MVKQMADQIRIVYCPVEGEPSVMMIDNTLEAMQKLVGGYIETITFGDYVVICNEEGRLKGLPENPCMPDYVGDILFARVKGDEFASLPASEAQIIRIVSTKFYGKSNDQAAVSG